MRFPRRALVLGANGQDGSYLVDHLLASDWDVVGVGRQISPRWDVNFGSDYRYIQADIADHQRISKLLCDIKPDYIFHAAATHGRAGFVYEHVWNHVLQVNTQSVLEILEYLRKNRNCGLCYISSSKVFGDLDGVTLTERSTKHPKCLYTISKNTSHQLINYYRAAHAIKASVAWTFNHESPRRKIDYFIPRLAQAVVNAEANSLHHETFEQLCFWGNWGSASEYMKILVNLADSNVFDDFILASPHTVWAEHFVQELFAASHLDWRNHIRVKRPTEGPRTPSFSVDLTKIKQLHGRPPMRGALDVTEEIIRSLKGQQ